MSIAATYQVVRSQTLTLNYRMEGALDLHIRMLNDFASRDFRDSDLPHSLRLAIGPCLPTMV